MHIIPVLLAGGQGKRLWPLSNGKTPKQFLSVITNNISFYQETVERVRYCTSADTIITVTAEGLLPQVQKQFRPLTCTNHIISEPFGRNTAAAIAVSALYAREHFGNVTLWTVPSDHVVEHEEILRHCITKAIPHVEAGNIITFGINPNRTDPNYGYIVAEKSQTPQDALTVKQFVEKPTTEVITELQTHSHCFWNSGMFMFTVDTILAELENFAPELLSVVTHAYKNRDTTLNHTRLLSEWYEPIPATPIDKVIMEHSNRLKVIPAEIGWMDIGSWQSLWEFTKGNSNATISSPIDGERECSNCLAYLNKRFAMHTN